MILRALELTNFGIFKGVHRLQFKNRGDVIGVLAKYENAEFRSNRSGKSLLLESIKYGLTGEVRSSKASDLIHYGEEMMQVYQIWEDDDGNKYKIRRGVDNKGKGLLELDWMEKSRESQEAINSLFGINAKDLDLTNYFKQADIHGFMEKTHAGKTEFLMRWLENNHWKIKEEKVKKDRDLTKEKLRDNESLKKALETSLEVDETLKIQLSDVKKAIKDTNLILEEKNTKLNKLIASREKTKQEIKTASNRISELKLKLDQIKDQNEKRDLIKKEGIQLKEEIESLTEKYKEEPSTVTYEKNKNILNNELITVIEKLEAAKNGNGICPILKTNCESISFSNEEIEKISSRKKALESLIKEYDDTIKKVKAEKVEYDRIAVKTARMDALREKLKLIPKTDSEPISTELENLQNLNAKKTLDYNNQEISILEDEIFDVQNNLKHLNKKVGEFEHRIESAKNALEKINEVDNRNEVLRSELEDLNYLCMMFGKNGIPADEIENAFQEIEDDINFLLKEMNSGLSVIFQSDKELTKWESACSCGFVFPKGYRKSECEECDSPRRKQRADEISLKVIEDGQDANFENDSGGGKTIISFAVRIALTLMKRKQNKSKLDVLFLDEIDGPLDPFFVNQIISSITRVLTKVLGFKQIFIISHREQLRDMVPEIIQVTRCEDNSSTVRFL